MKTSLILSVMGFLSAAFIGFAGAQMPPPRGPHPPIDFATVLGIDTDRAAQVEAILREGRERMRTTFESVGPPTDEASRAALHAAMEAIRSQTAQQLETILSPDEINRLHEAMEAHRPPPPGA